MRGAVFVTACAALVAAADADADAVFPDGAEFPVRLPFLRPTGPDRPAAVFPGARFRGFSDDGARYFLNAPLHGKRVLWVCDQARDRVPSQRAVDRSLATRVMSAEADAFCEVVVDDAATRALIHKPVAVSARAIRVTSGEWDGGALFDVSAGAKSLEVIQRPRYGGLGRVDWDKTGLWAVAHVDVAGIVNVMVLDVGRGFRREAAIDIAASIVGTWGTSRGADCIERALEADVVAPDDIGSWPRMSLWRVPCGEGPGTPLTSVLTLADEHGLGVWLGDAGLPEQAWFEIAPDRTSFFLVDDGGVHVGPFVRR